MARKKSSHEHKFTDSVIVDLLDDRRSSYDKVIPAAGCLFEESLRQALRLATAVDRLSPDELPAFFRQCGIAKGDRVGLLRLADCEAEARQWANDRYAIARAAGKPIPVLSWKKFLTTLSSVPDPDFDQIRDERDELLRDKAALIAELFSANAECEEREIEIEKLKAEIAALRPDPDPSHPDPDPSQPQPDEPSDDAEEDDDEEYEYETDAETIANDAAARATLVEKYGATEADFASLQSFRKFRTWVHPSDGDFLTYYYRIAEQIEASQGHARATLMENYGAIEADFASVQSFRKFRTLVHSYDGDFLTYYNRILEQIEASQGPSIFGGDQLPAMSGKMMSVLSSLQNGPSRADELRTALDGLQMATVMRIVNSLIRRGLISEEAGGVYKIVPDRASVVEALFDDMEK